jgi:2,4-dienoyl-CoA reductase-like NADH-dependent reductase (Old Yellow Enzyme family)
MSLLFETSSISSIQLANRFIRSATWEGLADDQGLVTPSLINIMKKLARGGVGLIITSHAFIRYDGKAGPWQLGICGEEHLQGLKEMTEAVHKEGGKIVLQLAHAGSNASQELTGMPIVGPSTRNIKNLSYKKLTIEDIKLLTAEFARAAAQAYEVGFDGIQLHAAHCYLFSQFLSPYYNQRADEYGGNHRNRAKALLETLEAVRREVGAHFPILAKINSDDTLHNGVRPTDMVATAKLLEDNGIDAIEISGGCKDGRHLPARKGRIDIPDKEVYYKEAARLYKEKINVPLILVGGIRSYETAERLINEGLTDYVSMSRPFIREPNLVNRWKSGDIRPSACLSDNLCYGPIRSGQGIQCVTKNKETEV